MTDNSSSLPHGFFDYVGENAELRNKIYNEFIDTGKLFGMMSVHLCPIGYETTFTNMGTINRETIYPFKDNGGRELMLSADSLSSMTRMFRNLMNLTGIFKGRFVGKSEIFRNRRKKYKNWSHLIGTFFNESNELAGDISIILFAKTFMGKYYKNIKFTINDYGILNEIFKKSNITQEQGYEMLYRMYIKKEENDFLEYGDASKIIKSIEEISNMYSNYKEKLAVMVEKYDFLRERVDILKRYSEVLERNEVNFEFVFSDYKAIEYHSGLYFYVRDDIRNCNIADGGGYHRTVNQIDKKIEMCHSFACSLEDIVTHVLSENENSIVKKDDITYVLKLDASDDFFYKVCGELRKLGYCVNDIWIDKNLKKILSKLPAGSRKVFVGKQEETLQKILIKDEIESKEINLSKDKEIDKKDIIKTKIKNKKYRKDYGFIEKVKNIKKYIISNIRKIFYRMKGYKIEKNVYIGSKVIIKGENVYIGKDTYIDDNVKIIAKNIQIGNNSIIFHDTLIYCNNSVVIGERNKISRNCIIRANKFLSKEELWCNENVEIGGGGWKKNTANIEIGPYTHIGKNSHLNVCSPIIIKGYTGIGMDTMMFTHSSGHGQSILRGYSNVQGKILVEENVSIFSRCIITPNTHIKKGVTIGANSFVKGVLDEKCFYAGSPVKKIKQIVELSEKEKEEKIISFLTEISEEKISKGEKHIFKIENNYLLFSNQLSEKIINDIEKDNYNLECIICLNNLSNYNKKTIINLIDEIIIGESNEFTEMIRDNFRRIGIILKPLNYNFKKLNAVKLKKNIIEL